MNFDTFYVSLGFGLAVLLLVMIYSKSFIGLYNKSEKPSVLLFVGRLVGVTSFILHMLIILAEIVIPIFYIVFTFLKPHNQNFESIHSISEGLNTFLIIFDKLSPSAKFSLILSLLVIASGASDFDDLIQSLFSKK